jgi:hypothetical protein
VVGRQQVRATKRFPDKFPMGAWSAGILLVRAESRGRGCKWDSAGLVAMFEVPPEFTGAEARTYWRNLGPHSNGDIMVKTDGDHKEDPLVHADRRSKTRERADGGSTPEGIVFRSRQAVTKLRRPANGTTQ